MNAEIKNWVIRETLEIRSIHLDRSVILDCYYPAGIERAQKISLLLINDGQDMEKLGFLNILEEFYKDESLLPLFCVGIHAGHQRKMEYGTAGTLDYKGRGALAHQYTRFIFEELLPFIRSGFPYLEFTEKAFAGFSLGGLSAMDIVWNYPLEFTKAGIFSGSFWWRSKDKLDKSYDDKTDRIMQNKIREGNYYPWLKFFFECGTADEQEDRNQNGIIDSIDDTLDIMEELSAKGYRRGRDIYYLELEGGKHDLPTWGIAMPPFLQWGWGLKGNRSPGN
jgi:enterochelin esterase-like enzyme